MLPVPSIANASVQYHWQLAKSEKSIGKLKMGKILVELGKADWDGEMNKPSAMGLQRA